MKTLRHLIDGLDVLETRGDMSTPITDVCYDSRRAGEGSLFVCMPGSRVDGHAFIGDALSRGAAAVVAGGEGPCDLPAACVRVRDTRAALASIAVRFYDNPSLRLKLIGITGTNGKTTTSLLIESILRHAGHEPGVLGTLAYRWGGKDIPARMTTPESLDLQRIFHEMLRDGVSHVVMEVSSHALSLGRVAGLSFQAGVFTNLSQDHLDFHRTMEDYFLAKKLLFTDFLDPGSSVAAINADDPYGTRLIGNGTCSAKMLGYSVKAATELEISANIGVCVEDARFSARGISAQITTPIGPLQIDSPLVGRLNLYNVLAAVSTALAMDIPPEAIAAGIRAVATVDGRLQRVPVPESFGCQVIVDYAHTPDAMEKALGCLREMTEGRLIAVFGCGGDRDRGKRPLMGGIAAACADLVVITSDNPRTEDPESILNQIEDGLKDAGILYFDPSDTPPAGKCYTRRAERREAIKLALSLARPGDLLFIGGKGHETYQIIGTTKYSFDDRIVVENYFQNRQVLD